MAQEMGLPPKGKEPSLLRAILGLKAWRVWIDSDFQVCLAALSYSIASANIGYQGASRVALTVVLLATYLAFMFLSNDYFDLPFDKIAGKRRTIYYVPRLITITLNLSLVGSSLAVAVLLQQSILFLGAYAFALFLSLFYSAPPLRLKERGIWGIVCATLIEKPLPCLLVFLLFNVVTIGAAAFTVLMLVLSLEIILHHQLLDYEADLIAGLKTFAVRVGREEVSKTLNFILRPLMAALLGVLTVALALEFPILTPPFLIALLAYFPLMHWWRGAQISRFRSSMPPETYYPNDPSSPFYFYYLMMILIGVLPLLLTLMAALNTPIYIPLIVLVIASQYYLFQAHFLPVIRFLAHLLS